MTDQQAAPAAASTEGVSAAAARPRDDIRPVESSSPSSSQDIARMSYVSNAPATAGISNAALAMALRTVTTQPPRAAAIFPHELTAGYGSKEVRIYKDLLEGRSVDKKYPTARYPPHCMPPVIANETQTCINIVSTFKSIKDHYYLYIKDIHLSFDALLGGSNKIKSETEISRVLSFKRTFNRFRELIPSIAEWCSLYPASRVDVRPMIRATPGLHSAAAGLVQQNLPGTVPIAPAQSLPSSAFAHWHNTQHLAAPQQAMAHLSVSQAGLPPASTTQYDNTAQFHAVRQCEAAVGRAGLSPRFPVNNAAWRLLNEQAEALPSDHDMVLQVMLREPCYGPLVRMMYIHFLKCSTLQPHN